MCRGLARGLAGALLLAFAARRRAHARGETSVWSMKGERNTVYLAGSVHALPKDHAAFPSSWNAPTRRPTSIVLEVDLDDMNPLEAVQVHHHERHAARRPVARGRRRRGALRDASASSPRRSKCPRSSIAQTRALGRGAGAHAVRAHQDRIRSAARHRHADHRTRAHRWQTHRRARDRHRPAQRVRLAQLRGTDPFLLDSADDAPKLQRGPRSSSSPPGAPATCARSKRNSSRNAPSRRRSTTHC